VSITVQHIAIAIPIRKVAHVFMVVL